MFGGGRSGDNGGHEEREREEAAAAGLSLSVSLSLSLSVSLSLGATEGRDKASLPSPDPASDLIVLRRRTDRRVGKLFGRSAAIRGALARDESVPTRVRMSPSSAAATAVVSPLLSLPPSLRSITAAEAVPR